MFIPPLAGIGAIRGYHPPIKILVISWVYSPCMPRIALIKGPNLRDDGNVLVWEQLNRMSEYDVVAFASDPPRYDSSGINLPVRQLPWPDGRHNMFGIDHILFHGLRKARLPAGFLRGINSLSDKFDLLHTNENFNAFSMQAALATCGNNSKFIFQADENIPYPKFQHNPLLWKLKQFVNSRADGITAITKSTERALIHEGVPSSKIKVLPSTVSLNEFQPDIQAPPSSIGLPTSITDEIVILFVHKLSEQKGTPHLIEAFEKVAVNTESIRLVLVGENHLGNEYTGRIKQNDQITWLEWVPRDQMPILYGNVDIFTLPSVTMTNNEEQFGMGLLEAMASGLPAVVTDVGGLPYVADPGESALIVQERSSDELANALRRLIEEPQLRRELGAAGRQRAEEVFAPQRVATSLKSFYDEVLD